MFRYNNEFKDSKVEYIGKIPKSWKIIRNKHIFNKTKVIAGPKWDKYNVLSLTKNGVIIKDIEHNEGKMPSDFSIYQIVNPGNLLMCLFDIDVTPRCVGYIENNGIVSAAYTELSPIADINMKYYYWWYLMLDIDKQLLHLSKNLRNSLSTEDFMALSVVKPPLDEQIQIANYLDKKTAKIDETIAKNKELIELLEEKRITLINQVVTKGLNPNVSMKDSGIKWIGEIPKHWDVEKIKNISQVRPSNVDKKTKANEPQILLCNYTDVYNNEFITMDLDFMKATATHDQIRKLSLDVGDVIITKDSESADDIAVPAIVTEKLENVVCGYHLAVIRPNSTIINPKFLFRSFESDRINKQFELGSNGVTRFGLGSYPINNAYICKPPLNEQAEIVQYLDIETSRIAKATDKILKHTELLEEYKTSLIHHVVTGKIDVREEVI